MSLPNETFEEVNNSIIENDRRLKEKDFINNIMQNHEKLSEHPIAKACFRKYGGVLTRDARTSVLNIIDTAISMYRDEYQYG